AGIAVVDRDLTVLVWNREAEDLWGLRPSEAVHRSLPELDIGLPVDQLRPAVRRALAGEPDGGELELAAVNRRGLPIVVRVSCTPLPGPAQEPDGVVIVMEAISQDG